MIRLVVARLLESYFRHRWWYLLPIALMTAAAGASFVLAKPVYISRSVLYVQQESFLASLTSIRDVQYTWVTPAETTVSECQELLQTDAFIRSVILLTDREADMNQGPAAVSEALAWARAAIWVQSLGDNLVMVAAADDEPRLAQQLVNGTIETYLQWRIQSDREESVAAEAFFASLITDYQADVEQAYQAVEQYVADHPLPVRGDRPESETLQIERLQSDLDLASTRLASARGKEEDARLALAQAESDVRQTYMVLDAPNSPTDSERSMKTVLINSLVFIVVGIILSGIGIAGGAVLDRSLRLPIDVHHRLDLPVLAVVPQHVPPRGRRRKRASQERPPDQKAEAA